MPKISIIVPVYNTAGYLKECFDSILAQTFHDFEIIVVDDGSTDNSPAICDEYAAIDNRFKVLHKKNEGVSAARNTALDNMGGKYVCFIDSDDYVDNRMLEKMIHVIESNNADIVQSDKQVCSISSLLGDTDYIVYDNLTVREEFFHGNKVHPSLCLGLYRADLFVDVRFPSNIVFWEDYSMKALLLKKTEKFVLIRERFYHYRMRDNSTTHAHVNERTLSCLSISKYLEKKQAIRNRFEYYDVTSFFIKFCICESIREKSFEYTCLYRKKIICNFKSILISRSISKKMKLTILFYSLFPYIVTNILSKYIVKPKE